MTASDYDFWILDLDGTLVDVEWSHVRGVFDEVGDRLGRRFTDREAELLWHGLSGSRNALLRDLGVDVDPFWETFHEVEDPEVRAAATYLHEDAAVIADLPRPVGVVTHCQEYLVGPVLDHLDLGDWFDVVVCCDDKLGWKPDPAPVEVAMAELDAGGGDAGVLVGDSPQDVGAAWNAGLDAVHVERFDHDVRGQCVLADHRIVGLDELVAPPTVPDGAGD